MSLSIFGEKAEVPTEDALAAALGESKALWYDIKKQVESACGNYNDEWKYYSKKRDGHLSSGAESGLFFI